MSLTIPLEQIRPEHATIVGGKAAVLAQMGQSGIAVPGGLSVTTEAYRCFIRDKPEFSWHPGNGNWWSWTMF